MNNAKVGRKNSVSNMGQVFCFFSYFLYRESYLFEKNNELK